jgi:ribulose-5-phosphate 4-epimerase/fuculose-1-phosphate aldolase
MPVDPRREGVVKFEASHTTAPLTSSAREAVAALCGWRAILFRLGLIGQDAQRYDGAAYGNVSARVGPFPGERGARPFVVSGTQTGAHADVTGRDFAVVTSWDVKRNRVTSTGPAAPSSESMTHGAVYDVSPAIRAVLHVHAPEIHRAALATGELPLTAPGIDYGTPAMALEVARLWRSTSLPDGRVFVMTAHEDGVVAFGPSVDEAGAALIRVFARTVARC